MEAALTRREPVPWGPERWIRWLNGDAWYAATYTMRMEATRIPRFPPEQSLRISRMIGDAPYAELRKPNSNRSSEASKARVENPLSNYLSSLLFSSSKPLSCFRLPSRRLDFTFNPGSYIWSRLRWLRRGLGLPPPWRLRRGWLRLPPCMAAKRRFRL